MQELPVDLCQFDPGPLTGVQMWMAFSSWRAHRVTYGCEHGWPGGMPALHHENVVIRRKLHDLDRAQRRYPAQDH